MEKLSAQKAYEQLTFPFYETSEPPSKEELMETVRFLCTAYKQGQIPDPEFENFMGRLLSFYVEHVVENSIDRWIGKSGNKYLRLFY